MHLTAPHRTTNPPPCLRRKEEAEEKRSRAKKARMGFMKMLAQNTQIDGRSRWSEAERTLQDDARFKAVPDSSDREDLFNEFVEALTKKEKVGGSRGVVLWDAVST